MVNGDFQKEAEHGSTVHKSLKWTDNITTVLHIVTYIRLGNNELSVRVLKKMDEEIQKLHWNNGHSDQFIDALSC